MGELGKIFVLRENAPDEHTADLLGSLDDLLDNIDYVVRESYPEASAESQKLLAAAEALKKRLGITF